MFGFIVTIFDSLIYFPLFNALVLLYDWLPGHDFGIAIISLTLIIRLILYPVAVRALNSQRALQKLQPKMKELQEKYKNDKEKQAAQTLELYKTEKINPFSGLFLALIQLPILIALYRVFLNGLKPEALSYLYPFIPNPIHINPLFLGLVDLSHANLVFALAAGILQFVQTKMLMPKTQKTQGKPDMTAMMQKQMLYIFPIITLVILMKLPSAMALYWIVSGIFSVAQQYFILKKDPK